MQRVAIQGIRGSFHHIAARTLLGGDILLVECATFAEVVRQVEGGSADTALLAIENSLVGSILPNYSLLQHANVHVAAEVVLRVRQQLLALPGATLADIREVRSHPMALSQCEAFLDGHAAWRRIEASDTAGSARDVANLGQLDIAAIAPMEAAMVYGLEVLAENIESHGHNSTRFWQLLPGPADNREGDRYSLSFAVRDEPGSLHGALGVIAKAGWNLSKIQSVPIAGASGRYRFFVDLAVTSSGEAAGPLLHALETAVDEFRLLGAYHARSL